MTKAPGDTIPARARVKGLWQRLLTLNVKEGIDVLAKLAAPAAVIVGAMLAQSFQSSQTTTQLLAAREEADTKIRAEMFSAITAKLLGEADPKPARRVVFAELLALNFHEHFELKPLMTDLDDALRNEIAAEQDKKKKHALEESRTELVSIVRRVRERQIAMLVRPTNSSDGAWTAWFADKAKAAQSSRFENGDVTSISVRLDGPHPTLIQDKDKSLLSACDVPREELSTGAKQGCVEEPFFLNAPDGRGAISVVALRPSDRAWAEQKFRVRVKPEPYQNPLSEAQKKELDKVAGPPLSCNEAKPTNDAQAASSSGAVEFETTWFDLPLTDNTPLWSGSRYAVFIDRICPENAEERGPKVVKLSLMWFPKDYFPPRERPTNYRELRKKLDLQLGR